ncbi:MAG: LVIVD repeat-containing protein [Solirubrobacterales bacterium]
MCGTALTALAALCLALAAADRAPAHEDPGEPEALISGGEAEAQAPVQGAPRAAEPPLLPTPRAVCGPGADPETGIQGRVSPQDHASGEAADGSRCNAELVGQYRIPNAIGTVAGFKVERYVDPSGRECAYYDTTLMWPTNALDAEGGVNVLDMSDPRDPSLTARLLTPAMNTPHESLVLSQQRGVMVAVAGNLLTNVGIVDVYDISQDCRNPVLKSSTPLGVLGHESGLAPDGKTFYSASPAGQTIVALDISNPSVPVPLWLGNYDSHGLSISNDGNRAYVAGINSGLIILDTTGVQNRVLNPTVREVSRLQWASMSIPQNAIPFTRDGHPYLVEIDEFGAQSEVGAGRIIDIGDETQPQVISNLRLAVHQPENFAAQANDNGAQNPVQGYAGHYCNVPTRVDPEIVACSMILSGLRVFDIRDPHNPREIAYFNAPVDPRIVPPAGVIPSPSNWAMSSPSFVPKRREIWYSDGLSGFYNVRLTNGVWPAGEANAPAPTTGGPTPATAPTPAALATPATASNRCTKLRAKLKKAKSKLKKAKSKKQKAKSKKQKRKLRKRLRRRGC